MIKNFGMPSDFKKETIDEYDRLNRTYSRAKIAETYGSLTRANDIGSGRVVSQLPEVDLLDLKLYIEYSQQRNIAFNYTMNATHLQNREFTAAGNREIKEFIRNLYGAGVRLMTVALPSLIEIIRSTGYDIKIKASTLCQITNVNKAIAYRERGVERMVLDESINRDFRVLRRICEEVGDKVELIVNPICLKDCVYRVFHYNQITQDGAREANPVGVDYYEHRCVLQRHSKISNLLRMCFIRPEDLKYYTAVGIRHFKLQGRHLVRKGDILKTIKTYLDENFEGDIMDLIYMFYSQNSFRVPLENKKMEGFLEPFVKIDNFCRRDCTRCKYCEEFARKIIDYPRAEQIIHLAEKFYSEYDDFKRMNESPVPAGGSDTPGERIEVSFDL